MIIGRSKLFIAGLAAFLVGLPLAGQTYAQGIGGFIGYIIDASIYASDGDS